MTPSEGRILWTYLDLWKWLSENTTIAFTHGIYDLFHDGHKRYIEFGCSFGVPLLVGVNTDVFAKMKKGHERPIEKLESRMAHLLQNTNAAAVIPQIDRCMHLELIRPAHYIISRSSGSLEEYAREITLVEKYGGTVHIKDEMASIHTTDLIREMRIAQAQKAESV